MFEQFSRRLGWIAAVPLMLIVAVSCVATDAVARDGDVTGMTPLTRLFTGLPTSVEHADPYVFVGLDSGIEAFDVTSATDPQPLGNLYLDSAARDITIVGSLGYVAAGEQGLVIIDVSDPNNLVIVGSVAPGPVSGADACAVAVEGTLAFLAEAAVPGSADYGVRVLDVSDPAAPFELGYVPLDNGAHSIAIIGSTAFVGIGSELGGRAGLIALDVSDPTTPGEIGGSYVATGVQVNGIGVVGGIVFAAAGESLAGSLLAINVATPAAPVVLDRLSLLNGAMDIALRGGVAQLAMRESGLVAVDVSDPSDLRKIGALPIGEVVTSVVARGDVSFVGARSSNGQGALATIDTLSFSSMSNIGWSGYAEATAVAATPGLAFLLRRDALQIFDTSTPSSPVWLAGWGGIDGDYSALDVEGNLAAVAEGRSVHLVDVTDPALPNLAGIATVGSGIAVRVVLSGSVLYIVTGTGLEVFDITSPSSPAFLGAHTTAAWSSALAVNGNTGYLVAGATVQALDLSSPTSPSVMSSLTFPTEQLRGVAVDGSVVVLTGLLNYLYVLDATLPSALLYDAALVGLGGFDIRLIGDRAVIAAGRHGVRVVDVSDTLAPVEEAYTDTSGIATVLATEGRIVYLASLEAQHWAMLCDSCTASCAEDWPSVEPNSLRAVKMPTRDTFTWMVGSGIGSFNLHQTAAKTALPSLFSDMGTWVQTVAATTTVDAFDPAVSTVAHYRVYGAGSCTGSSYP